MKRPTITLICPLYNAEGYILSLHKSLKKQKDIKIVEFKYILTESSDKTEEIMKNNNIPFEKIKKSEFSHSLTREKAAMSAKGEILVFLTQDVVIKDDYFLSKLVAPIVNCASSAAYARQLTKYNNLEKYTREFNYPGKSRLVSREDIDTLGMRVFFFSDAACAVSAKIFRKIGGYDGIDLPMSEDMYLAYKLIMQGYKIQYAADAKAYHSHDMSFRQVYDRYWRTGMFMKMNPQIEAYGARKEGGGMAKYLLKRVIEDRRVGLLVRFPLDMAVRYIGMQHGKHMKVEK